MRSSGIVHPIATPSSPSRKLPAPQCRDDFQRRGRYKGWQPRPNRIAASEAHIASELAARRRQLSDLLRAVEGGASYHISGVANLLRLLIATGEPLPHLQLVAAAKDLPLIVYTERNPTVFAGAYEDLSFAIWPRPTDRNDNPIDLDVWLDLPAWPDRRKTGHPPAHADQDRRHDRLAFRRGYTFRCGDADSI